MSRKGKLPADRTGAACLYRSAQINRADANDEDRSIPMILATETPVEVYDINRMEVVNEIIRMDGIELPSQVPLVDSHERSSVRNVLGSIRDLQVQDGRLIGRAYFSRDADAQRAYDNYRDGHLTDFSIGAKVTDVKYDGNGNKVVVRSQLLEGSAVVAGHDPNATVLTAAMRAYVDPHAMKDEAMLDALKQKLIARGLPEDATDEQLMEFVEENITSTVDESDEVTTVVTTDEAEPAQATDDTAADEQTEEVTDMSAADTQAAVAAERARIKNIDELCRKANVTDEVRRSLLDSDKTTEQAALEILQRNEPTGTTSTGPAPRISGGTSEREKFYDAVRGGIVSRAVDSAGVDPQGFLSRVSKIEGGEYGKPGKYQDRDAIRRNETLKRELEQPVAGASDFQYASLPDIARMFLERSGERVDGLPKVEICRRAMAQPAFITRADSAVHTTGSFSNLMLDAANKTLLAGYDEAEHTYSMWVRTAPSAADFKQLHRIRFGEMADPEVVPENHEYKEKTTSDAKESYGVEKYGEIFSISLEAIVNDDLNAITRIPQMQGFAMRRKINKVVYSVLTANDALSDGIALFHASSHGGNLDTNALAESALDTGFTVMSQQTGLSGTGTPLGIRPSYLIVPSALAATAWRLVTGGVVPTSSGSNVPLYGEGRPRSLMVIEEAQLDANSTTGWYLAANSGAVETVELTFLQGEESPVLSREDGFSTDTIKYKIRQTFAAKAIDYRGLYQGKS